MNMGGVFFEHHPYFYAYLFACLLENTYLCSEL
nr:MAG TPA: hypothetical protein [Caudoviricetes sp.]